MGKVEFLAWQSCDICEEADKIEQMMQVDILASYRMTAYAPVFYVHTLPTSVLHFFLILIKLIYEKTYFGYFSR